MVEINDQIKVAVMNSVENTFESYMFAEVLEKQPLITVEDSLVVSQTFSSHLLRGKMTCIFPMSLLTMTKEILHFENQEGNWHEDYALEFLNSITGGMMGSLLDNETFELSLPQIDTYTAGSHEKAYFFSVLNQIFTVNVEVAR